MWPIVVVLTAMLVPAAVAGPPAGAGVQLTVAAASSGASRPTLSLGTRGADVLALQQRLRALGTPVSADGRFGPATRLAVVALQAARGLGADGIVGPRTWAALDGGGTTVVSTAPAASAPAGRPLLRLGAAGPAVADAQRLLTAAGQRITADGRFGPSTSRAVVAFQQARHLTADGMIGPATWAALAGTSLVLVPTVPLTPLPIVATVDPWRTFGARSYVVRSGDTLSSVATATGSTAAALATANRIAPSSHPPAGTTLLVPGAWRCPVPGGSFINDYGFARAGHLHEGNDLFALRNTPILAPLGGRVERREGGLGGHALQLYANDGNRYYFAHLDHFGAVGTVAAGTVIGYVGNSGNAITTVTHLHFEIHPGGGAAVNPFPTLTLACKH